MITNIAKSIISVIAGFITVAALSIVTDAVLEIIGLFPPQSASGAYTTWMLALALSYRSIYTILGGYVTAKLAPQKPMNHVYALMIIGGIGGIAGAIFGWSYGNHWYPIALAISGPIFVWIGGKIFTKNK